MNSDAIRTRIAPTPSGYLHIGNLFSFVITWLLAKAMGGSVRLRIDDLDAERMRPQYLEDIFETLEFIGLQPDDGPSGIEDFLKNHSQQLRIEIYRQLLNKLILSGHLYACRCTRKDLASSVNSNVYPGTCRQLEIPFNTEQISLRMALPASCIVSFQDMLDRQTREVHLNNVTGDIVVQRRDGLPAYHLASLADDIKYGINMVVRGEDLMNSTGAQIQISRILGNSSYENIKWHHHRLLKNSLDEKLSKSAGDTSVQWMIKQGISRKKLLEQVSHYLFGERLEVFQLSEFLEPFHKKFAIEKNKQEY